ncbi:hypothetical protein LguiA_002213 [Lonicera macranthoides]
MIFHETVKLCYDDLDIHSLGGCGDVTVRLNPEKSIPSAVLKEAKSLAILTVAKAGMLVSYKLGTGLVIARRQDRSWSAPFSILSFGLGWGCSEELEDSLNLFDESLNCIPSPKYQLNTPSSEEEPGEDEEEREKRKRHNEKIQVKNKGEEEGFVTQ